MSKITQLICNNFGGIRQRNAVFSADKITAQDLQNVELYYTGLNNGIGLRTAPGNKSINDSLVGSHIIEIFESVQLGVTYFFVYAETALKGTLYNYNKITNTLTVLKDDLNVTGNAQGLDIAQGWTDLFFFTNGQDMFTVEMNALQQLEEIVVMEPQDREERDVIGLGCALWAGRLWIFNKNTLWYSVQENIYDFATADGDWETSAGYIEFAKDITAIHPYLGALAVFYKDSSELLSVSNGAFSRSDESPGGCAGINSLIFHDTDLFFYDDTKKAVFSFKQIINGQKTLGENIAVDIQEILHTIKSDKLDKIRTLSVFIEERNEIWWILPTNETFEHKSIIYAYVYDTHTIYADSPTTPTTLYDSDGEEYTGEDWEIDSGVVKYGENSATYTASSNKTISTQKAASIILIFDYLKGEWIKRKSQKINTVKVIDSGLYSGADDGNILEEYNSETFNGDYIQHFYNCSPLNLGATNTLKVLIFPPRVSFDLPSTNEFYVKYVKNFDTYKKAKVKLIKSKLKNFMKWDVNYWDKSFWMSKNTNITGKFPSATFKVLEISIYTENEAQSFKIRNIEFSKVKVKQV